MNCVIPGLLTANSCSRRRHRCKAPRQCGTHFCNTEKGEKINKQRPGGGERERESVCVCVINKTTNKTQLMQIRGQCVRGSIRRCVCGRKRCRTTAAASARRCLVAEFGFGSHPQPSVGLFPFFSLGLRPPPPPPARDAGGPCLGMRTCFNYLLLSCDTDLLTACASPRMAGHQMLTEVVVIVGEVVVVVEVGRLGSNCQ